MAQRPLSREENRRGPTLRERKKTTTERGYGWDWQRFREGFIAKYRLCTLCLCRGRSVLGRVVDHVEPHKGNDTLRLEWRNLQTLCPQCHAADKQAIEQEVSPVSVTRRWRDYLLAEIETAGAQEHVRCLGLPPSLAGVLLDVP